MTVTINVSHINELYLIISAIILPYKALSRLKDLIALDQTVHGLIRLIVSDLDQNDPINPLVPSPST